MSFKWSRCRRCGRTLTDPAAARAGVGKECAKKTLVRPSEAVALMDALDTLASKGHRLEPMQRFEKTDLNLYAAAINAGAPLRAATKRLLLRHARTLKGEP